VSTVEPWSLDADIKNGNDSASDSDMEQTFSESDDVSLNRSFQLPRENLLLSSNGPSLQDHAIIDVGSGPVETTACIPVASEVSVFSEMSPITNTGYSEAEAGLTRTFEALSQEGSSIINNKEHVNVECGSDETAAAGLPVATEVSVFSEMTPLQNTETFSEAETRTYETLSHEGPIVSEKEGDPVKAEGVSDETTPHIPVAILEVSVFPELAPIINNDTEIGGFPPEAESPTYESLSHEGTTTTTASVNNETSGNVSVNVESAAEENSSVLLPEAAVPAEELLTTTTTPSSVETEEVKNVVNEGDEMESDP